MSLEQLVEPFPWYRYSKKVRQRIENPFSVGYFDPKESEERGVRCVEARDGFVEDGNAVAIYWLVDKEDGIIVDAKFQVFGQTALTAAADVACEVCIGKNYDQAKRISADILDRQLRDKNDVAAFPRETCAHLNLILDLLQALSEQCDDLPLAASYVAPPMPTQAGAIQGDGYPGWMELPLQQKIAVIEKVLDDDIRPYIALDAGGVSVLSLNDNLELTIGYHGTCTSCYSSVGSTLSYIQQLLRAKVHPELVVIPDL